MILNLMFRPFNPSGKAHLASSAVLLPQYLTNGSIMVGNDIMLPGAGTATKPPVVFVAIGTSGADLVEYTWLVTGDDVRIISIRFIETSTNISRQFFHLRNISHFVDFPYQGSIFNALYDHIATNTFVYDDDTWYDDIGISLVESGFVRDVQLTTAAEVQYFYECGLDWAMRDYERPGSVTLSEFSALPYNNIEKYDIVTRWVLDNTTCTTGDLLGVLRRYKSTEYAFNEYTSWANVLDTQRQVVHVLRWDECVAYLVNVINHVPKFEYDVTYILPNQDECTDSRPSHSIRTVMDRLQYDSARYVSSICDNYLDIDASGMRITISRTLCGAITIAVEDAYLIVIDPVIYALTNRCMFFYEDDD